VRWLIPAISFDREAGFAIQQLGKNDYMMKAAQNNRQAVVDAVVNIAAIGISLNPAKKQAYLVPRDNKICLDISYMGLMDLAQATGSVKWAQAALVHETDTFTLNGLDKAPNHTFDPFSKDRGAVVGVYVTIKTVHGEYLTHTMTIEDAYAIRDRSSAWKLSKSGPWKTDEGEMIKKTCVKQAYKYWPKTERLETAIHHLNTENGEGLAVLAEEASAKPVVTKISAREALKDEYDSLTPERQQIVTAVVNAATDRFNADDIIGAYDEYTGLAEGSERMGAWYFLPSNVRTALTKYQDSLQKKAA
jgi:recombination protein RecT